MAAPGWPDWLSHLWYRAHYAAIFAGMTTAMSFRFAGGRHMPPRGPALLVANHQSFFDPPLVGLAVGRTIHYLARKTLYAHPAFAWFLNSVNAHPVDQEGVATEGLRAIMELLKNGQPVLVFPEGERTWTGKMQPLKAGVHFLIKRVPVPIVPVGIAGAFEAYPRMSKLPKLSPLFLPATNHTIAAVVGKPLDPEQLLKLSREEFLRKVFDAIQAVQIKAEHLRRKS
jgi:1-acyl-sn-glycerol-3-phosphate acyltransferase